jgi:hypothetical protein
VNEKNKAQVLLFFSFLVSHTTASSPTRNHTTLSEAEKKFLLNYNLCPSKEVDALFDFDLKKCNIEKFRLRQ